MVPKHEHIDIFPLFMACLGAIMLGMSPIFVRVSDLGPMTTGFYRMLFGLPLVFLWMVWEEKRSKDSVPLSKKDFKVLFLVGLFFAIDLALWNWSIDYTSIVNSTLFNNTAAFFAPLLLWVFFKERQSIRLLIAITIGLLGCFLILGESFTISLQNLEGDLVALLSGVMVGAYVIAINVGRKALQTGRIMFWSGLVTVVLLGFVAAAFGESFWPLTSHDVLSVFGQSFLVHFMGQGFLAFSMRHVPASYAALIMLLTPATAAVLGWVIYGEILSTIQWAGILIVLSSIVAVKQRRKKRA